MMILSPLNIQDQLRLAAAKPVHDKLIMDIELLKHKLLAASYGSHGADISELFDHYDKEAHHLTLRGRSMLTIWTFHIVFEHTYTKQTTSPS